MVAPTAGRTLAHIAGLKVGVKAVKYGRTGLPQLKIFTVSEDETTLSWKDANRGLSSMAKRTRSIRFADVANMVECGVSAEISGANISLHMQAEAGLARGSQRSSLDLRCANAVAHARWVSALGALIAQARGVEYVPDYKREEELVAASKPCKPRQNKPAGAEHTQAPAPVSFGDMRERWMAAQAERESAAERAQEELEAEAMAWAEVEETLAEAMEVGDAAVESVSQWNEAVAEVSTRGLQPWTSLTLVSSFLACHLPAFSL